MNAWLSRVVGGAGRRLRRSAPRPLTALYAVEARLAEAQAEADRCAASVGAALVGADEAHALVVEALGAGRPITVGVEDLQAQLQQVDRRLSEVRSTLGDAVTATNVLRYGSASGPATVAAPRLPVWRRFVRGWSWARTRIVTYVAFLALLAIFWWRDWVDDWASLLVTPVVLVSMASAAYDGTTGLLRRDEIVLWSFAAVWAATPVWHAALGTASVASLVTAAVNVAAFTTLAVLYHRRRVRLPEPPE